MLRTNPNILNRLAQLQAPPLAIPLAFLLYDAYRYLECTKHAYVSKVHRHPVCLHLGMPVLKFISLQDHYTAL